MYCTVLAQAGGGQSCTYRNVLDNDGTVFRILRQGFHRDTLALVFLSAANFFLCQERSGGRGHCLSTEAVLFPCSFSRSRAWGVKDQVLAFFREYVWEVRQQAQTIQVIIQL